MKRKRTMVKSVLVAVVAIFATSLSGAPAAQAVVPLAVPADHPTDTTVLWVHGLVQSAGCPGIRSAEQSAPFKSVLVANGYTGPIIGIDYYCGDSTGVTIMNAAGPATQLYDANMSIKRLGLDLAWFIYNTYTTKGKPVSVAAHSMGGLITAYAVTHVGQPGFPPTLNVQDVVTFSTPYGGIDKTPHPWITPAVYSGIWCGQYTQCKELVPGSPFIVDLAKQTIPASIDWTTVGGGPQDIMTYAMSSKIAGADHKVDYYATTPMTYNHENYITDTSLVENMPARIADVGVPIRTVSAGPHSLNLGAWAMRSSVW